ncbi:MAG: hypothetical protein R3A44_06140 [Caldilineaceae bacterium]
MNTDAQKRWHPTSLLYIRQSQLSTILPEPVSALQRFVIDIVTKNGHHIDQGDLNLLLTHPEVDGRLLIAALYEGTIMLAHMYKVGDYWIENMLAIVNITPDGWIPEEVRYSHNLWSEYIQSLSCNSATSDQSLLTDLTEYIAARLKEDEWLEYGQPVVEEIQIEPSVVAGLPTTKRTDDPNADFWD